MPEFDGQLQRSASNATLVSLDFSDGSQIRGLGIFESINGSTQPTRDSLPSANRANGYIAVVKNVNKVYVFNGVPANHWTNSANWTELGGTDLSTNATTDKLELISSSGNNVDLPAATASTWGVMTDDDKFKLNGIEALADVTDEANVKSALDGMTLSDIGSPDSTDRVLIQDANDSNNIKYADFSEFGGGGDITSVVAGFGLTGGAISGAATLNVVGGTGITANANDIAITNGGVDTDQLADDAVTEDKLDDTLLAEIDANTSKATNVSTNLGITGTTGDRTITSSDGTPATIPVATDFVSGVMSASDHTKLTGIELNATADQTPVEIRNIVQGADLDMGGNDITTTGKILFSNLYAAEADLPSASTYHGMFAHVHATGAAYFAHGGSWIKLANKSDVTSNDTDITNLQSELDATQLGAGLNTDGTYTANAVANYTSSSTSLADADSDLDAQVRTNADAINLNTTHRGITSSNPHGTSLGQVSDVSTSGGATNDVLAQNSSGSFDLKNPFDLFMAAAETVGDFPTSGATLGDINGDGIVGIADLLIFLGNYQSSIFDVSFQSITFTSMSSTPVSIQTSSLNESNYNTQATLSNLTRLNIGAQTTDNSISPYDWIVNQTNDYIQFYTTDGSDISGSSGFEYFDNAKVQVANPTNLQVSVEATPDNTIFALYCYIETIYPSSTQTQLKLVGTYSVNDFDQTIDVNQDAANPIVIDHHLFAVNSGEYPTAARIYFYVGVPNEPEYGTFTCSVSDLKLKIIQ